MSRIVVAVVALLAATLAGCGGEETAPATTVQDAPAERDAATVESEDGSAVLNIPAGALPEGVTPEDIEIREVSDDPAFAAESARPLVVYQLEPDGLQLLTPITLTVELAVEDSSGQIVAIQISEDKVELVADLESEFLLESSTLAVSMQLSHFSAVVFTYVANPFEADVQVSAQEVPLGETFGVTVVVTRVSDPVDVIEFYEGASANAYIHLADAPWRLTGSLSGGGSVRPRTIEDVPPLTSIAGSTFTIPTQTFECGSPGDGRVTFLGPVQYQQRVVWAVPGYGVTGDELEDKTASLSVASDDVECVMPRVVASAAPPLTTYTLSPEIPSATFFAWSGANCGSVTGSTTSTMVWDHGQEGCEHGGEPHPDAEISVLVIGTFPISGRAV